MKGQMFMLIAVIVIVSLLMLRNSMTSFQASSDDRLQRNFADLRREMVNVVDLSLKNQDNMEANLNDFVSFSIEAMRGMGYNESVQFSVASAEGNVSVSFDITLSYGSSYMQDSFIVNRRLFT